MNKSTHDSKKNSFGIFKKFKEIRNEQILARHEKILNKITCGNALAFHDALIKRDAIVNLIAKLATFVK